MRAARAASTHRPRWRRQPPRPTRATAGAPRSCTLVAARYRATYPTKPTTASAAAIATSGAIAMSGRSPTITTASTALATYPARTQRRRARVTSDPVGTPSARCSATAGNSAIDAPRTPEPKSRTVAVATSRPANAAPNNASAPTKAASAMISVSGSRGRWTATNTAASAHAATSTMASGRPGPSGTRSPTRAATTTITMATTASAIDPVARVDHGGRSGASSRMLARSRGWMSSSLVATVTPIVGRRQDGYGQPGAPGTRR